MAQTLVHRFEGIDDPSDEAVLPSALGNVRLDWSTGDRVAGLTTSLLGTATDRIDYRCSVIVVDEEGRHLRSLPVTFFERVIAGRHSLVIGADSSGSFRVHLEAELPPTKVQLHFEYRPVESATPADLLPSIELLDALSGNRRLGLWSLAGQRWAQTPMPLPADVPRLPDGYASTVGVLARVQRLAGETFPMPAEITKNDADSIRRADRLVSGSMITGRWQRASITVDQEGFEFIRSASEAHGALLELTSEYFVEIGGRTIALGPAQHRLFQVFIAAPAKPAPSTDSGGMTVELVPGDNDRFEISLISGGRETAVGDPGSRSFDAYAGRWIAQEGDEVVEIGDTPAEVLAALRRRGRTGAVWRVPQSREEAEGILTGSL